MLWTHSADAGSIGHTVLYFNITTFISEDDNSHFLCFSDFDCILTNLELKKLDKNRFQLPEEEQERTQSILKRALDVEKGVSESAPVTEEHPDGRKYSTFELGLVLGVICRELYKTNLP
jgi:hypothetical protein